VVVEDGTKADETAVFALPYAEVTAVPTLENCPLTPRAVLPSFDVIDEGVAVDPPMEVGSLIAFVGQIDDRAPGEVTHPE
jgi:hypothetical protein